MLNWKPKATRLLKQTLTNTGWVERRQSERRPAAEVAYVASMGDERYREVLITNISDGGLCFCSQEPHSLNSFVALRRGEMNAEYVVLQVVHCSPEYSLAIDTWRVGCRFV